MRSILTYLDWNALNLVEAGGRNPRCFGSEILFRRYLNYHGQGPLRPGTACPCCQRNAGPQSDHEPNASLVKAWSAGAWATWSLALAVISKGGSGPNLSTDAEHMRGAHPLRRQWYPQDDIILGRLLTLARLISFVEAPWIMADKSQQHNPSLMQENCFTHHYNVIT